MGGALTADERKALEIAPCWGFPAGSNMWPLVEVGHEKIQGEVFDGLLRKGYLRSAPLPEPILTDRSDDYDVAPDCEVTHDITLTEKGLRVVTQHRFIAA